MLRTPKLWTSVARSGSSTPVVGSPVEAVPGPVLEPVSASLVLPPHAASKSVVPSQ